MVRVPVALPSLLLAAGGDLLSERPPCPHMWESLAESSLKHTGILIAFPVRNHLQTLLYSCVWQPEINTLLYCSSGMDRNNASWLLQHLLVSLKLR